MPAGLCQRVYDGAVQNSIRLADLLANAITHGVGAALAIVGAVCLIAVAAATHSVRSLIGCTVFGATLIVLYLASTLYHALSKTRARKLFQIFDHAAIYLLIAGTYTPFALVSLHGRLGWTLLGLEWGLAAGGVIFKCFATGRYEWLSAGLYLAQGWVIVVAFRPLLSAIGWAGVSWILAGGVAYTGGLVFYALDSRRFFHALWHVFVLAGSVAHYCAVLLFVARR
jgi:hemolysin III